MAKPSQENFYKRLNKLAGSKSSVNENSGYGTLVDLEKSDQGISYGIVKENHKYYIKKSNSKNENLDASDFAYIGGLENKYLYEYNSLGEAEKQRNFYVKSLNEAFSLDPIKNAVSESEEKEEKIENPFNYLKNRISEGKEANKKKFETKFKSSLKENVETTSEKKGLMPEAADKAVKKALGKLDEQISTEDSEQKESDRVSEKKGKEEPQAPINDSNAKKEAEKAMGKDSIPEKEDKESISVNQTDKALKEEASPLSTDDSEIIASDSMANKTGQKHEPAQAPVNDTNAKAIADKNVGKSASSGESMPNQAEESKESDPLDDKEDSGDEKDDIVTEGKALSTEDSDQDEKDRIANSKKITTKPEADYNNHNQPEKGQKEEKGEELKPKKEKDAIVAEGEAMSTKDSQADKKIHDPKKSFGSDKNRHEKAITTADSEIESEKSPVNQTNKKKKGSGKSLSTEDSEENPDDSVANKTKTNLPNPVAEAADALESLTEEDLSTADSEIDASKSLANEKSGNINYDKGDLKKGTSFNMDDNAIAKEVSEDEEVEDELDSAAQALDNMDVEDEPKAEVDVDVNGETPPEGSEEEPEPEADVNVDAGDEMALDIAGGEEAPESGEEVEVNVDAGDEGGEEKVKDEEKEREAQSKIGEFGEIVRDLELDDEKIVQLANQAIEPLDTEELSHNDQLKIQSKLTGEGEPPEGGEEAPETDVDVDVNAEPEGGKAPGLEGDAGEAIDQKIQNLQGEGEEEMCAECGTFEGYAKSRGYDNLNECGGMELANLMSGYANAYADGQNDGDFEKIAIYLTPEIETELADYGHDDFLAQAEPFKQQVSDEERLSPGSFDVQVPSEEEEEEVEMENESAGETKQSNVLRDVLSDMGYEIENMGDIPEEDLRKAFLIVDKKVEAQNEGRELTEEELNELGWRDIKNVGAGIAGLGQKAGEKVGQQMGKAQQAVGGAIQKGVDKAKEFGTGVKQTYHKSVANNMVQDINQDAAKLGNTIAKFNAQAQKAGQQPIPVQSIMQTITNQLKKDGKPAYQNKFEGEQEEPVMEFAPVAQNLGVSSPAMSESEKKVRDYIKKRLEENIKGRKNINESKKPESLKKFDRMIDEQWDLYQKQVKK